MFNESKNEWLPWISEHDYWQSNVNRCEFLIHIYLYIFTFFSDSDSYSWCFAFEWQHQQLVCIYAAVVHKMLMQTLPLPSCTLLYQLEMEPKEPLFRLFIIMMIVIMIAPCFSYSWAFYFSCINYFLGGFFWEFFFLHFCILSFVSLFLSYSLLVLLFSVGEVWLELQSVCRNEFVIAIIMVISTVDIDCLLEYRYFPYCAKKDS